MRHPDALVPDRIRGVYKSHTKKGTRPSAREYLELLQEETGSFSKIFLVIDALDECRDVDGTRGLLMSEIKKLQPTLRLLVTSRPHISDIERMFSDAMQLEVRANSDDVQKYIDGRIDREVRLKHHVDQDPTLRHEIIGAILAKVDGMYISAPPAF